MGATKGIGEAISKRFYKLGANVMLVARSQQPLTDLQSELAGLNKANAVAIQPLDITNTEGVEILFNDVVNQWGSLDILVNNAAYNSRGPVETKPFKELEQIVTVNLTAQILNSRAAIPHLKQSCGQIINIASLAGRAPVPGNATYSATKFGLRAFSMALREELAPYGISVSLISPGPVITPFIMDDLDKVPDIVFSQPVSTADEIAQLIEDIANDQTREKVSGKFSGFLTHFGYLFPAVRTYLEKPMERKGARVKQKLQQQYSVSSTD